ncbi:hypothetical protein LC1Hm_0400 [Halomicrobium sp. LC1Hm]|nr:hypothetical protein LC1Hm_0400 [Halomicrobium sp. LC1Hm]
MYIASIVTIASGSDNQQYEAIYARRSDRNEPRPHGAGRPSIPPSFVSERFVSLTQRRR